MRLGPGRSSGSSRCRSRAASRTSQPTALLRAMSRSNRERRCVAASPAVRTSMPTPSACLLDQHSVRFTRLRPSHGRRRPDADRRGGSGGADDRHHGRHARLGRPGGRGHPGATYRLLVEQPPFSVVVLFDTSGSVVPSSPSWPRRCVPTWAASSRARRRSSSSTSKAHRCQRSSRTIRGSSSTRSMHTQAPSPARAARNPGSSTGSTRWQPGRGPSVFLMTDAETASFHRQAELWRWLGLVQPRVFTMQVSGAFVPRLDQQLMQDWAAVGGGAYDLTRAGGDIERAFDRMATWLRRPADYGLVHGLLARSAAGARARHAEGRERPERSGRRGGGRGRPRGPDRGRRGRGDRPRHLGQHARAAGLPDAAHRRGQARAGATWSPSSSTRGRRSPSACSAGAGLVRDRAGGPAGTARPGRDGRDDRGAPIDRTVRTPLAAAIAAVAGDLASVTGPRVVIVVSDGQESCGGDPGGGRPVARRPGLRRHRQRRGLDLDRKTRRRISKLAADRGWRILRRAGRGRAGGGAQGRAWGPRTSSWTSRRGGGARDGRRPCRGAAAGDVPHPLAGADASLDAVVIESGEDDDRGADIGVLTLQPRRSAVIVPRLS